MSSRAALSLLALTTATIAFGACSSDTATGLEPASLSLTAAPRIQVSPTSITVYSRSYYQPPQVNLRITNGGGRTLHWTASSNRSWITLSSKSGTGPSTIVVTIGTRPYVAGLSWGTITVSATGASNSPQQVLVKRFLRG